MRRNVKILFLVGAVWMFFLFYYMQPDSAQSKVSFSFFFVRFLDECQLERCLEGSAVRLGTSANCVDLSAVRMIGPTHAMR